MKKFSVIVGIPAHNEEKSIERTLKTLLKQERKIFSLKKIIVFSDNSSDKTNSIVKKQNNKLIKLVASEKRVGKTNGIKQLLEMARKGSADFLIIIDADLKINSNSILKKLVEKISLSSDIAAVSGTAMPLKPKNIVQKICYFGFMLQQKQIEKLGDKKLYFKSGDAIIILRVNEFGIKRIKDFAYMHDEFYYLFCKKYGKKFDFEKDANAYFRQPSNLKDYVTQMSRYISTHLSEAEIKLIQNSIYQISLQQKILTYISFIKTDYFIGFLYLCLQTYCHVLLKIHSTQFINNWSQIKSTK